MPITEAQRKKRQEHIGGSDVAAILGVDKYKSAYEVWAEKTGRLEPADLSGNEAVEAGQRFEDGVLDFAESRLGPLQRNQYRSCPELHLGTNCDALARDDWHPVEAKTSGLFGPLKGSWGEAGTDQVPDHVLTQVHAQMLTAGSEHAHVAAFLGGQGFRLYEVPRNPDLADLIAEACQDFWALVEADTPPQDAQPAVETLKRVRRRPGLIVRDLPAELIDAYEKAKAAMKEAKRRKEAAQAEILRAMGEAEAAEFSDGRAVTCYAETRKRLDSKALRAERPEIWGEYAVESVSRRMRVRKKGLPE